MFIIYEFAGCVLVAMIVAGLAVTAFAIYPLLKSGQGTIERGMHHLMHGASRLAGHWVGGQDT